MIYILEAQAEFVRRLLDTMSREAIDAVEIKRGPHDAFNAEIQAALDTTVWAANCSNYFRHPSGKMVTQYPYSGSMFAQRLAAVDLDIFDSRRKVRNSRQRSATHDRCSSHGDRDHRHRTCTGLLAGRPGFTVLFDHVFTGDWPTLFDARTETLQSIFLGDPSAPDTGIVELVVFDNPAPERESIAGPAAGFFLVSLNRDVEPTLRRLAGSGIRRRYTTDRRARTARKAGSDGCHHGAGRRPR